MKKKEIKLTDKIHEFVGSWWHVILAIVLSIIVAFFFRVFEVKLIFALTAVFFIIIEVILRVKNIIIKK